MNWYTIQKTAEANRKRYPVGTRVRLDYMDDFQAPPVGTLGTVRHVDDIGTIHVAWDNGSGLGVCLETDSISIVEG